MRKELKYRVWDEERCQMIYFTLDDVILVMGSQGAGDYHLEEEVGEELARVQRLFCKAPKLDYMEYIGMKDKNGKDVYKDDILSGTLSRYAYELGEAWNKSFRGVVEWVQRDQLYGFYLVDQQGNVIDLLYATHRNEDFNGERLQLEIIGNVPENPELIASEE